VLQQGDLAPGSQPLPSNSGPKTADQIAQDDHDPAEASTLGADGFRGAYTAAFVSPTVAASGGAATMRVAESYIAVFPTPTAASRAVGVLHRYATSASTANPLTELAAHDLGSDAFVLHSQTPQVIGHDYVFTWRVDNALFTVIVGTNSNTPDVRPAQDIAQSVARRAAGRTGLTPADLPGLSLPPQAAPPGTQFDQAHSGPRPVESFAGQPPEINELRALGYQAGYVSTFLPQSVASGNGASSASLTFSSVQLYATTSGAKDAFRLLTQRRLRAIGQGLGSINAKGLGDEAVGFSFSSLQGQQSYPGDLYAFRRGNLVCAVYGFGPPGTVAASNIRRLADTMDSRAH
jgi:hypothetical protein